MSVTILQFPANESGKLPAQDRNEINTLYLITDKVHMQAEVNKKLSSNQLPGREDRSDGQTVWVSPLLVQRALGNTEIHLHYLSKSLLTPAQPPFLLKSTD